MTEGDEKVQDKRENTQNHVNLHTAKQQKLFLSQNGLNIKQTSPEREEHVHPCPEY